MLITLFGNTHQDECLPKISYFIKLLALSKGVEVVADGPFYDYLEACNCLPDELRRLEGEPDSATTLALSFGGDGTFLGAAHKVAALGVPLMGINTGHLGYLAGMRVAEAPQHVADLIEGRYVVEERRMLQVEFDGIPDDYFPYALNEVAILKQDSAAMITVDTLINGSPLATYKCDGLILSTPTGSTAYSLSVGGPIVDPQSQVMIVAPVAPHSLTMRPLVVRDSGVITAITSARMATFRLSLDGRSISLPVDTSITIRRAPISTRLARLYRNSYLHTLRSKLYWGQ